MNILTFISIVNLEHQNYIIKLVTIKNDAKSVIKILIYFAKSYTPQVPKLIYPLLVLIGLGNYLVHRVL